MKDVLLVSAETLAPPAETAIQEFEHKWEQIAAQGTRLLFSTDAWQQIYPFYNWLIVNIPKFTAITDTDLSGSVSDSPDHLHGNGRQR